MGVVDFLPWASATNPICHATINSSFSAKLSSYYNNNKKLKINNVEMEGVKTAIAGAGSCVLCLLATACSILPIVFVVYLGIYAFNNPDQEAWYGLDANGK